jgi:UDP-glucose 4-epimerase
VKVAGTKVLVTGADGFIGSHLVERLVTDGASVRAMCLYNSQGSWGWLDGTSPQVRDSIDVRLGDVRDAEWVSETCKGVQVVLHLAALIAIPYSYTAPRSFVDTNVTGTLNVLEGARRAGVELVVNTSTSEVYGTPTDLPIRETHPLNAQSPYAATKVAADQLALSYHRSFGVPVAILRPFNTFGPRQSTRAVIPTMLTQLMAGRREIQLGRLDTRRDLTYVTDTVDGFVRTLGAEAAIGNVTQLGTHRSPSIQDVFDAACRVLGVEASAVLDERRLRPDPSEVLVLESDPSVAAERLSWKPTVSLEEGLRLTALWLQDHLPQYKADFLHR